MKRVSTKGREFTKEAPLAKAERYLEQAQQAMFAGRADFLGEEWALLANLVVGAHEALADARRHDPEVDLPLYDVVMEELRDVTAGFTNPHFLRSTRSSRRSNPDLFRPR